MSRRNLFICMVIAFIGLSSSCWATTYYVDPNGSDDANGLSWETAFETIQHGISNAGSGDVVEVNEGTYNESVNFQGRAITVRSTDPDNWDVVSSTIIDGGSVGVSFTNGEGADSILKGFKITECPIAIRCTNTSPTIRRCLILMEQEYLFCGAYITGGSPLIENCIFKDVCDTGIAASNSSSLIVRNCLIYNIPIDAVALGGSSSEITNCTIVESGCGIRSSTATVTNCILWDNNDDLSGCSATYSCIEENGDDDPCFVDAANGNYRLLEISPCVNTGDPNHAYDPNEFDLDGQRRIMGPRIDMGAYELFYEPYIYVNHTGSDTPPYNSEATATRCIQTALDFASSGDTVWIKADQDYVMNGTDQQAAEFDVDQSDNVTIKGYYQTVGDQDAGGACYKDPNHGWAVINANNGNYSVFNIGVVDGLQWHNIKTTNVNNASSFYALYDTEAGDFTDDYLIQNCWTTGGYSAIYSGGIRTAQIRDCKFTGSYGNVVLLAWEGIVTNYYSAMDIDSCKFICSANSSIIFISPDMLQISWAEANITNNLFNVSGSFPRLAFIHFLGTTGHEYYQANISNNTFYKSGTVAPIGIQTTSFASAIIKNNIFVNFTESLDDISNDAPTDESGWNCFDDYGTWTPQQGDMEADPCFVDAANGDFHLLADSNCINAGDPNQVFDPNEFDLGGFPRVMDGRIDIGAYEFILNIVNNITQATWYEGIQDAVNDASTDDLIKAYPGTYDVTEALTFSAIEP